MTNSLYCLLLLTVCISADLSLTSTDQTTLGEAFNIQKVEVDGVVNGGKSIFVSLPSSCFTRQDLKESTKNYKVYTDHQDFVHEIALSVGLTAKEIGGKGSINTKYLKKTSTDTSGTMVEVVYLRDLESVSTECLEEAIFQPGIIHDLKLLPYPIHKPHIRGSWLRYDAFIHKWGSHILKSTEFGAKAIYHTTKTTKAVTDKKELQFKLCAKFPELNLDGCVESGPKTSSTTSHDDETNEVFVLGGTRETQDKLRAGEFTVDLLDKLSEEADEHQAPIKHEWLSLPELLLNRLMFEGDEETSRRATALVSYYKGYHVFGCDYQQTRNGDVMTVFRNEGSDEFPDFKCFQVPAGCRTDKDCRNWPLKYLGPCYCAGQGCVSVKKEGKRAIKSKDLIETGSLSGSYMDATNSRCVWSSSTGCSCLPAELEEAWPTGSILLQVRKPPPRDYTTLIIILLSLLLILIAVILVTLRQRRLTLNDKKAA